MSAWSRLPPSAGSYESRTIRRKGRWVTQFRARALAARSDAPTDPPGGNALNALPTRSTRWDRNAAREAVRLGIAVAILVGAIALGECLGGCGTVAQLAEPVTDWAEDPSFEASAGVKLDEGRWTVTGGVDLGWLRAGVGGGCLVAPITWCWKWPAAGALP